MARAAAAFRAGRVAEAEAACRELLHGDDSNVDARHLLGLVLFRQERWQEAVTELERAARLRPQHPEIRRNLAIVCREGGMPEAARGHYLELARLLPDSIQARVRAAELAMELGQDRDAQIELEAVLAAAPDQPDAGAALAQLMEQRNEDQQARALAQRVLQQAPDHFMAAFVLARVLSKSGALDEAETVLEKLAGQSLSPLNRSLVLGRWAQLEDRRGRYQRAFERFTAANRALADTARARTLAGTSVYGRRTVQELQAFFDAERLRAWGRQSPSPEQRSPVFVLGFPRSGTTLLDTMLGAHPQISVVEERPLLAPILDRYAQGPESLQRFEDLDAARLEELAEAYLAELRREGGDAPVVIDKLPLNTLFLPIIHRVFPRARVVFAVRDPRDVCLSCFFQSFGLNEAMSYFLDWESTARYYAEVMGLGLRYLDHLPIEHTINRYESLVQDPESEIRRILELLGLPWDEGMRDPHRRLAGRRINTPSYEQVNRPVYRSAVGRWRHYRPQIRRIEPLLAPFIDRFGWQPDGP